MVVHSPVIIAKNIAALAECSAGEIDFLPIVTTYANDIPNPNRLNAASTKLGRLKPVKRFLFTSAPSIASTAIFVLFPNPSASEVGKSGYPPKATIASSCAVFKPASKYNQGACHAKD